MKVIQKTKEKLSFVIETNETLANAIRRSVNEIPIFAIEEVEIHKNDSALYDEILGHRMGLIPLKEGRKINETEKCSCEGKGCNKCQIQMTLKAKGPGIIYAGELKGDVEVLYPKMPIVLLDKDQELEIIGFGKLGKAIRHTKFSSGLVYYRNITEIHIKNAEAGEKLISKISESLLNAPKGKVKSGEVYKSYKDLDYVGTLINSEEKDIEIRPGEEIIFNIEAWGQITPIEMFSEAVKALNKNLNEIAKVVKK